ncbi:MULTISPECIES: adenosylcobinamide-GDP ribazoletransferase [unclassified Shewanella]|uniref:adenosylcobinamide-GDP ribazoletransferase n=1 Tax=unclassified Shewanella TaxID=196818 RepID=UPI000C83EEF1|nr:MULTISPECIES: adenosylcobinamide-GDP ribazoletransferase [unclassified Shewanella]MDO6620521.1 adenosylcobinamide-GDP ribazoletransferase [Shewanella sp. 6_MG-2023]MDO6777218.1 adenosylcobinamide-GDP ribazoletransferase [Shewanella sp. 3_MG-2023]PMG30937.1 cobalamin 5'-phosphate synthase [Shewanella sp. 10N.286.52.C2]PMG51221.1 cobalamin 5'-phosphate synthase [Shewanella sp. 10N.286.52.B9]
MSNLDIKKNNIFNEVLAAISFLTRFPFTNHMMFHEKTVAAASRWFSLVGLFIGFFGAAVYFALSLVVPHSLACVVTLVILILATGAFHEDGLADLADGFGGGWDKSRKLAIMKDSQIGTYGVLALISTFAIKLSSLQLLSMQQVMLALITAHGASRAISGMVPFFLEYARIGENKTPQKSNTINYNTLLILTACGFPGLLLLPSSLTLLLLATWLIAFVLLLKLMKKQINGYTGDTLGATQQVIELLTYICFVIWTY